MKSVVSYVVIATILLLGCVKRSYHDIKFDSATSVLIEATITDGFISSNTTNKSRIEDQIREQLKYAIGHLAESRSAPQLEKARITVKDVERYGNEVFALYSAEFDVSWNKQNPVPDTFTFVLPRSGHDRGIQDFYNAYVNAGCLDTMGYAHPDKDHFWYDYRPHATGCPLARMELDNQSLLTRTVAQFKKSGRNTSKKAPEYHKVWEDKKLVVLAMFGLIHHPQSSGEDIGSQMYHAFTEQMKQTYGAPFFEKEDGARDHALTLLGFRTPAGEIQVANFLIESTKDVGREFLEKYNRYSRVADLISYSGHAGLGSNVKAFGQIGELERGQYQVYVINGCTSFAYLDEALREKHQKANPRAEPSKYYDVVLNSMPTMAFSAVGTTLQFVKAFAEQRKTYKEILEGVDPFQMPVVLGEEDNRWPAPF